jgi:hypothetical protein
MIDEAVEEQYQDFLPFTASFGQLRKHEDPPAFKHRGPALWRCMQSQDELVRTTGVNAY